MSDTVFINGKFTAQRTTGVQRVALNLLCAIDAVLATLQASERNWTLLIPPGGHAPPLRHIRVVQVAAGPWRSLHAWEQLALPWAARNGLLLNFGGTAPLAARRQFCMLHDAAVFDHPEAYTWAFRNWYQQMFRLLASSADLVFTPSEFSRQRLAECLNTPRGTMVVLPGAADHFDLIDPDPSVMKTWRLQDQAFFLAVGSDNLTKNIALLLDAYAAMPNKLSVALVLVGGSNARVFKDTANQKHVEGVIRTGPISDAQLKALYQHALAFIFPSRYEGFGLPPLEAMRCGCPVAAAQVASIPEVCGDAALYFDPGSEQDLLDCLQRLALSPDLRDMLRQAGTLRVRQFSWSESARKVIESVLTRA